MEKFKKMSGKLIVCLAEIAIGVVLLTNPEKFTMNVIIGVGALLCVAGVMSAIRYFRMEPEAAAVSQELVRGLIALAAGLFCVFDPEWFVNEFPLLTGIYGIALILAGIVKLQWTVDMLRLRVGVWYVSAIAAVLSVALGLVVMVNPFSVLKTLWTFTAIALIVTGAVDGVNALMSQRSRSGD